jgi:hypothetical protein
MWQLLPRRSSSSSTKALDPQVGGGKPRAPLLPRSFSSPRFSLGGPSHGSVASSNARVFSKYLSSSPWNRSVSYLFLPFFSAFGGRAVVEHSMLQGACPCKCSSAPHDPTFRNQDLIIFLETHKVTLSYFFSFILH